MMSRKAQATLFIIFGIIILTVLALAFFYKESVFQYLEEGTLKSVSLPPQAQEIDSFVKGCIKEVGYEALYTVGMQGGYFTSPKLSTESGVPYYFIEGKSYVPSKQAIENEISSYVNRNLFFCTKSFVSFKGFDVEQGRIATKAEIRDNEVVLSVNYPLTAVKDGATFKLTAFKGISIPVRLGLIYEAVETIIKDQLEDKTSICISCLTSMRLEEDMHIEMIDYSKDTVIFTIRDDKTQEYKKPYKFVFANKYY